MEGPRSCMNAACQSPVSAGEWKEGWKLRSGDSAVLCNTCWSTYEQHIFCDVFHPKETGWRECLSCGKRLHCGCIISRSYIELLDCGGVQCASCRKKVNPSLGTTQIFSVSCLEASKVDNANVFTSVISNAYHLQSTVKEGANNGNYTGMDKRADINIGSEANGQGSNSGMLEQIKREHAVLAIGSAGNTSSSIRYHGPNDSLLSLRCNDNFSDKVTHGTLPQACLDIGLGTFNSHTVEVCYNSGSSHNGISTYKMVNEEREPNKTPSSTAIQQWQRSRYLLPKPPRVSQGPASETSKEMLPHIRVARPPAEGRGRNQLLPRYWPRITDQELQQISGDSNSTIVPLFEKVLSASDAGRIGRLVLPKACAEAYFPPISQPEGLPLKIQDAKGKEWVFQFRFWPNNNSRMYVLEGVTPCIQSMQLQAGDTVTFSRIDPEGKLVMGFRKATNTSSLQDSQIPAVANGSLGNENFLPGLIENFPIVSGYSGFIESLKGSALPHLNASSVVDADVSWHKMDSHGGRFTDRSHMQSVLLPEKRRSRNIGNKSKRLHINNEDAMELKLTWEEAQDLLRPPPSVKPSIVIIEDHEFEEYEEPPVFGKKTIFTTKASGYGAADLDVNLHQTIYSSSEGYDQWAQCDVCFKWRRLPVDAILPSKWTCADNTHDRERCSCSAPDELSSKELQSLLQQNADLRKRKIAAAYMSMPQELESPGLDALAIAASLGDDASPSTSSVATTTKHPRHRPGCTCIVCIQPPSGKGPKHPPSCTCNVCLTVKRRFKTLMMRKKKRQSEQEAEINKKLAWNKMDEAGENSLKGAILLDTLPASDSGHDAISSETLKARIDLNFYPLRVEDRQAESSPASTRSLLQVAGIPLEAYAKAGGQTSLAGEQVDSTQNIISEIPGETERTPDDSHIASVSRERDSTADEVCGESDQACNDST